MTEENLKAFLLTHVKTIPSYRVGTIFDSSITNEKNFEIRLKWADLLIRIAQNTHFNLHKKSYYFILNVLRLLMSGDQLRKFLLRKTEELDTIPPQDIELSKENFYQIRKKMLQICSLIDVEKKVDHNKEYSAGIEHFPFQFFLSNKEKEPELFGEAIKLIERLIESGTIDKTDPEMWRKGKHELDIKKRKIEFIIVFFLVFNS